MHRTAFLTIVDERHLSRVSAWLITLLEHLQAAAEQVVSDLTVRNGTLADFSQLVAEIDTIVSILGDALKRAA